MKLLKQRRCTQERSDASLKRGVNESGSGFFTRRFAKFAISRFQVVAGIVALFGLPTSLRACAACYGQSDSPLASGVTWGILSLLAVVMAVLGSIVSFFVYINKKSAAAAVAQTSLTNYPSQFTNH